MRGYIIIEAQDEIACRDLILNEPHVKGMLPKPLTQEEIDKVLAKKQQSQDIAPNDLVEFFAGPFKGYKAKVINNVVESHKTKLVGISANSIVAAIRDATVREI